MGKKGNWFSSIKRALTGSSKDKPVIAHLEKKDTKDKKKWIFGKPKNGEISTFIPLCREPSSIEKILGDADKDLEEPYKRHRQRPSNKRSVENERAQYHSRHRRTIEHERDPYHNKRSVEVYNQLEDRYRNMVHEAPSTRVHHVQQVGSNRSPQVPVNRFEEANKEIKQRSVHQGYLQNAQNGSVMHRETNVTPKRAQMVQTRRHKIGPHIANAAALMIQKAFRGYLARRNYRALKGLIRLQTMMRGHGVKRQTMEAMKSMTLLVKVQTQIHARRVEMMESRASQHRHASDADSIFGRWSNQNKGDYSWNDSVLTKEEVETRMRRKVEAVMKRERALAYAYSHQLLKATPATATAILADLHTGASQWSWTPFDRHASDESNVKPKTKIPNQTQHEFGTLFDRQLPDDPYGKPKIKRPIQTQLVFNSPSSHHLHQQPDESYGKPKIKRSPQPQLDFNTPVQNESYGKPTIKRSPQPQLEFSIPVHEFTPTKPKLKPKTKTKSVIRDDDSLTSCPAFTQPNYMTPTVSAKAKVKARVHDKREDKKRFSFGIGQSLKWGKGSFWKDTSERISNAPSEVSRRHRSTLSVGSGISIDSAVSMPVVVGRRPFR